MECIMKIFKLYYEISDTCGNSDRYLVGYFQEENINKAKQHFPVGMLRQFIVEELELSSINTLKAKTKRKVENGEYQ